MSPPRPPLRQLSGHAAGHLYTDTAQANANVSLVQIHDQRTAPGGVVRFKSILAHIERRLHVAPLFRQRLLRVPLGLDRPYWVDDEYFDLEYHVRHIALPKPGDWRQFCIQISRIHARPLDLDRPLWEAYVIEGLDSFLDLSPGSFALLFKSHQAALDLAELGTLTQLLYDTDATPPPPGPPEPWFADAPPGKLALVRQGILHTASAPLRLARPLARAATHVAPAAVALASEMLLRPENLPVTRFNSVVSPHRVFETRRFTDEEIAAICRLVPGATVDDAVLAIIGGALRLYLDAQGELPEGHGLTAILPVLAPTASTAESGPAPERGGPKRGEGQGGPEGPEDQPDEALAWRHVPLGTEQDDPVKRLAEIHARRVGAPDAVARTLGDRALADAAEEASASLLAWSRRWVGKAGARLGGRTPPANATVAMLPAPRQPMFLCGARLTYTSAILPISDGLGLAFAVTRYDGRVVVSPTSCRELMPDPEVFAQALRDSFQAYLKLAGVRNTPPAPPPLTPKAKAVAKQSQAKKLPAKQAPAKKTAVRTLPVRQAPATKAAANDAAAKKAAAKKAAAKRTPTSPGRRRKPAAV